jgi:L-lactate dehydrogenase complex protein LldF
MWSISPRSWPKEPDLPVYPMPTKFQDQIRTALADAQLQSALDGNAERRLQAFTQAFASVPGGRVALRARAHAMRARVIDHLEDYLAEFSAQAAANGITVHHAADAAQALEIVSQIAQSCGAKRIAKSKTMLGEEIRLNQHLEAKGLKVVETDLGEYIVQLRGEPPAHIITPAVHLTRSQVGHTFEEKLGLPYTTDIPTLTAAARRVLRQTFLEADIGVSGVNAGVVESGTLCLVTNEGNGRMCTTLPDIHIALMGIERLVPTFDDLALLLSLLPRSATGQKLSVYTSLIHGPRREGEYDGPSQRHLVLIDNGRLAIRQSALAEALYCIRCGACLNVCPVFREIGGHAYIGANGRLTPYPGPIGSVISPGLFGVASFGNLARASSLCGACKEACPVDIDLPKLLLRIRAADADPELLGLPAARETARRSHVPTALRLGLQLFSWAAAHPPLFALSQRLVGIFSRLLPASTGWMRLPAFTGWGMTRDFPRPTLKPFSASKPAAGLASKPATGTLMPETQKVSEIFQVSGKSSQNMGSNPILAASTPAERSERFALELNALGGTAVRCQTRELATQLLDTLRAQNIDTLQAWDGTCLPPGLLDDLQTAGMQVVHQPDPAVQAGLTGALAGIAETGSLVIPGGPGKPLTASLLPETHLAILQARDILDYTAQALALPQVHQASAAVLITGPSRTADIEMTLTIGVHGPKTLVVFILEPD